MFSNAILCAKSTLQLQDIKKGRKKKEKQFSTESILNILRYQDFDILTGICRK